MSACKVNSHKGESDRAVHKLCTKCNRKQPLNLFYTKGKDRKGKVRHDPLCKKCKLALRARNAEKLRLVRPRSAPQKKINLRSCGFVEIVNQLGAYLPSQIRTCLTNLTHEVVFSSRPPDDTDLTLSSALREEGTHEPEAITENPAIQEAGSKTR